MFKRWVILIFFLFNYLVGFSQYSKENWQYLIGYSSSRINEAPTNDSNYIIRGEAYYNLGMLQNALSDFNNAIKLNSKNDEAIFARGGVYYDLHKYDSAIADFRYIISIKEDIAFSNYFLGVIYYAMDSNKLSKFYYTSAIKDSNTLIDAYFSRGLLYLYHLNDFNNAKNDFYRAIKLSDSLKVSSGGNSYINLAYCFAKLSKFKQADSIIDYLYAIDSTDTSTLEYRGYIELIRKNNQAGCRYLKRACDYGDKDACDTLKKYSNLR